MTELELRPICRKNRSFPAVQAGIFQPARSAIRRLRLSVSPSAISDSMPLPMPTWRRAPAIDDEVAHERPQRNSKVKEDGVERRGRHDGFRVFVFRDSEKRQLDGRVEQIHRPAQHVRPVFYQMEGCLKETKGRAASVIWNFLLPLRRLSPDARKTIPAEPCLSLGSFRGEGWTYKRAICKLAIIPKLHGPIYTN